MMAPSSDVLQAFGATGKPQRLAGGEGNSYRAGNIVLKPVVSEEETSWRSALLSHIPQVGFWVARSIQTRSGQWAYGGWEASQFLEGQTVKNRWQEKISVCRLFHAQIRDETKPAFIDRATHPWAVSDRMVWGEQVMEYGSQLAAVMQPLEAMKRPMNLKNQLIHGDMAGNILFHSDLAPAVIDVSPYWRPAEFAVAVIIVDSIVWDGADGSLLTQMDDGPAANQLLVRAALWRIKSTEECINQFGRGNMRDVNAYQPLIALLRQRELW